MLPVALPASKAANPQTMRINLICDEGKYFGCMILHYTPNWRK